MRSLLVILAAAVLLSRPTFAQTTPRVSEIAAAGRGEIRIVPDRAVLMITVENNASSAATAASENARIVSAVMNNLRSAGATGDQLSNSGYSIDQDFDGGDRRRPRGFIARNTVRIDVPRVAEAGKLIDAALAGGATLVAPIQYLGPDMTRARREALKAAADEARRDAEVLAEASGGTLGRLVLMTSGFVQPQYGLSDVMVTGASAVSAVAMPTSIRPGSLVVTAMASGRWEFVPGR